MPWFGWLMIGAGVGAVAMLPVLRLLLRRGELRARQAERRARDSERLAELGRMTSGLAHEIKNPLSTIGLNAQLLAESVNDAKLPEDQRGPVVRRIDSLRREVERLSGILTDFLQFAGRIKLDRQPKDLRRIVEELTDFFDPQCRKAGVVLRTQLPASPLMASIDETLLKQALLNLMINATQAMSPEIGDLILKVEERNGEALVHVIDTGPGIPAEHLEEIFMPYVSHRIGGTGLGLPTTRRIVEEHGGRLEVQTIDGQGTAFVVHLPQGQTAPAEPEALPPE